MRISKTVLSGFGAGVIVLAFAGCGGGGNSEGTTSQAQAPTQPAAGGSLTINVGELTRTRVRM